MAKEKKCDCPPAGAPMWVVTYGDLMSLLMTFFVLLLSFASMDKPREYEEAIISIKGAFGVLSKELTMVQINPNPMRLRRPNKKIESVARRVQRGLQVVGQQKDIELNYDATGGLKITLPGQLLYRPGEVQLRPEAYPVLNSVGQILKDLPEMTFVVRGHTDNTPMPPGGIYRDNYDLSFARADAVMRYMSLVASIPMDKFQIVAAGESEHIATNTTEAGRDANRRVDILVRGLMENQKVIELQERVGELTTQQ